MRGYTIEFDGALYVPLIIADRPGQGDVARYLDSLPRDRTVKFPNVLSHRLAGMLARRGFRLTAEYDDDGVVPVWKRDADATPTADPVRPRETSETQKDVTLPGAES